MSRTVLIDDLDIMEREDYVFSNLTGGQTNRNRVSKFTIDDEDSSEYDTDEFDYD